VAKGAVPYGTFYGWDLAGDLGVIRCTSPEPNLSAFLDPVENSRDEYKHTPEKWPPGPLFACRLVYD